MSLFSATFQVSSWEPDPPRDLGNFEPLLAAKLSHFWRQMDWPWFPQNFGKNWHFRRDIIPYANRDLKWPISCNILGLLLRASFPPRLGPFWAVISCQVGPFLGGNELARIPPNDFGEILGNWHFWRDINSEANLELKWPIFGTAPGLLLRARSPPEIWEIWGIMSRD